MPPNTFGPDRSAQPHHQTGPRTPSSLAWPNLLPFPTPDSVHNPRSSVDSRRLSSYSIERIAGTTLIGPYENGKRTTLGSSHSSDTVDQLRRSFEDTVSLNSNNSSMPSHQQPCRQSATISGARSVTAPRWRHIAPKVTQVQTPRVNQSPGAHTRPMACPIETCEFAYKTLPLLAKHYQDCQSNRILSKEDATPLGRLKPAVAQCPSCRRLFTASGLEHRHRRYCKRR